MKERRKLIEYRCAKCAKSFQARKPTKDKVRLYCSLVCHTATIKKEIVKGCAHCGKLITCTESRVKKTKHGYIFCDRVCKEAAQKARSIPQIIPSHYDQTPHPKYNYRKRALAAQGETCSNRKCPLIAAKITIPTRMLDVDHVDGNRKNNKPENLQVLCVWCHAVKTRGKWSI